MRNEDPQKKTNCLPRRQGHHPSGSQDSREFQVRGLRNNRSCFHWFVSKRSTASTRNRKRKRPKWSLVCRDERTTPEEQCVNAAETGQHKQGSKSSVLFPKIGISAKFQWFAGEHQGSNSGFLEFVHVLFFEFVGGFCDNDNVMRARLAPLVSLSEP